MLSRKTLAIASLSTIVCSGAAVADDGFKSSKFLTYAADSQKSYINTSVLMATLIAAQNSKDQATCIGDWSGRYVSDGYQPVIEAMRKFPDHPPTGVILAVLQKACGPFAYK